MRRRDCTGTAPARRSRRLRPARVARLGGDRPNRSLSIGSIKAEFTEATRSTRYSVLVTPDPGTTITYQWTLTLTAVDQDAGVDQGCNNRGVLTSTTAEFVWHHGNKGDPISDDGCNHNVFGKYGHQGLITVTVRDNLGAECTATYKGTNSSDANSVANGVASDLPAPLDRRRGAGGGGTAPFPVKSGKVTGTVLIKVPGSKKLVPLKPGAPVPNGSLIDTTKGTVQLPGPGGSDVFYAGQFTVFSTFETTRAPAGVRVRQQVVELRLAGGNFRVCRTTAGAGKAPPKTPVRSVWGKGKGRFRTKGRYAAATVRGTFWLTRDRCDGTYVLVKQGKVDVLDFPKRKTVRLSPGKSLQNRRATPRRRP